ncbi:MAG: Uma2 family endonuclease [Limnothrix sp. RL_2_0]|nr:Uma2 family endonuclease [Limnothrix sp. RL_2_0]
MVTTPIKPNIQKPVGEQRVIFHRLSWDDYLQIFNALPQRRNSRLTYDGNTLEITMPLEDHEFALRLIERFILILVFEMGMKLKTMGSTTINREKLQRGSEPDCAFYIQNQPKVAGRNVDFETDPPPDLIVEVDITHTDIDKNRLYAAMGVPEFWRYNGEIWRIFQLENSEYQECEISPTFPQIKKNDLYNFLAEAQQDEIEAEHNFRSFIREQLAIT